MVFDQRFYLIFLIFISCESQKKDTNNVTIKKNEMNLEKSFVNIECSKLVHHLDSYLIKPSDFELKVIINLISEPDTSCNSIDNFMQKLWKMEGKDFRIDSLYLYKLYCSLIDIVGGSYLENTLVSVGYNSYRHPVFFAHWLDTCSAIQQYPISDFVNDFGADFDTNSVLSAVKWRDNLQNRKKVFSKPEFVKSDKIQVYLAEIDRKLIEVEKDIKYLDSTVRVIHYP